MRILILKTGALGDVLRTTSILPGLHRRWPELRVSWLTARAAEDLVAHHPLVARVYRIDPRASDEIEGAAEELSATAWDRILSFDDEEPFCRLATRLARGKVEGTISGAYLDDAGGRRYSADTAPWFDMGLISTFGKEEADRRKVLNRESHPSIYARMLGIEMGEPELPLSDAALAFAADFAARTSLDARGPVVGLNTGAGGRWESKRLSVERTVALAERIDATLSGEVSFLVLGGPDEAERNAEIVRRARASVRVIDAGTGNSMLEFASLVDRLALLVTSDSLALHLAIARHVKTLAFFAPTSAAEIELYGRGEKIASTAPDYCSYRADTDTSTLTVDRLAPAALRLLSSD